MLISQLLFEYAYFIHSASIDHYRLQFENDNIVQFNAFTRHTGTGTLMIRHYFIAKTTIEL